MKHKVGTLVHRELPEKYRLGRSRKWYEHKNYALETRRPDSSVEKRFHAINARVTDYLTYPNSGYTAIPRGL